MRHPIIVGLLCFSALSATAQVSLKQLAQFSDSLIQHGLEERMVPGLALVLIKEDSLIVRAYGMRNVDKNLAVDTTTLFQLGSVGKLFTAIAVLQQVEAGKLSLSADVNSYLQDFSVSSPSRTITLFDLLTHTAGFNDRNIGYVARSQRDIKPLGEHLREHMPTTFQPPGKEINYSNYSYALAGHLVELVTGTRFTDYVQQHIFLPLGMNRTTYELPDNYSELEAYASGYRTRDTFEPVTSYPRHAVPAGSALSCASDMARFLSELLRPTGKILRDSSMTLLRTRQFTNHPRLMGYTLGMEEQHFHGVRGIGKGGAFTGFLSEVVIFPDQGLGLFMSINTQTDNFPEMFHRHLLSKMFPQQDTVSSVPYTGIDLTEFAGVYRSERYNHHSVEDLLSLYQGKLELALSDQGDLTTYQNGAWQHYRPVDSLLFQNTNVPNQYLAFERDGSGEVSRLYTDINLAGFYVPMSFSPVPWYDDPEMINEYYFLVLVVILTFLFVPFFRIWVLLRRRRIPEYRSGTLVPNGYVYLGLSVLVLYLVHFFGGFMYLAQHVTDFYSGVPDTFRQVQQITWLFPVVVGLLVVGTVRLWLKKKGTVVFRAYYTLICLCAVIHLLFLYRWHFIGLHV